MNRYSRINHTSILDVLFNVQLDCIHYANRNADYNVRSEISLKLVNSVYVHNKIQIYNHIMGQVIDEYRYIN